MVGAGTALAGRLALSSTVLSNNVPTVAVEGSQRVVRGAGRCISDLRVVLVMAGLMGSGDDLAA